MNSNRRKTLHRQSTLVDPNFHPRLQLDRIYERDKGICQLCFEPCARDEASRDHIVEVAYCTPEQYLDDNNVRLAHIFCNNERSNNPESPEYIPDILENNYTGLTQSLADIMPPELLASRIESVI